MLFQSFTLKMFKRAHQIANNLGYRSAAGFLRNRAVPFEEAHLALLGRPPRFN